MAMQTRSGILTAIAATLLSGCAWSIAPPALAADLILKAEPASLVVPWWLHYYVEVGARGFLNNPQRDGVTALGGRSLAKYYEYSTIAPGPFLYGWVSAGSIDGVYQVDAWAKNVGYSDQAYEVDFSKAGRHYLGFEWDQTPHVYSTSARTLYNGVGSTSLTLPPGLSNQMFTDAGCLPGPAGCGFPPIPPANAALVQRDIVNNAYQTDLGIRRDTAAVDYRYTPNDNWDFRANYSHMRRTGTQVDGVLFGPSILRPCGSTRRGRSPIPRRTTAPAPNISATRSGTRSSTSRSPIAARPIRTMSSGYTVENPFCPTGAVDTTCAFAGSPSVPVALMSLWPSNQANGVSATMGADLPWRSRYMATVAYTNMRQNDAFLPFTITPFTTTGGVPPGWAGTPGIPVNSTAALPAQSLNGNISTLLMNNVITTQITPDLKFKANYRYYNYHNGTPEIRFADWVHVRRRLGQGLHRQPMRQCRAFRPPTPSRMPAAN